MRVSKPLVCAIASTVMMLGCGGGLRPPVQGRRAHAPVFQRGMSYVTWSKQAYGADFSDSSLQRVKEVGADWVALVPAWHQAHYDSTQIGPTDASPSDESLIHAITTAHQLGLKVMLKPHVDLTEGASINWRGEIDFPNTSKWNEWFASYRQFIVHYATLAEAQRVDLFCVGTELSMSTLVHSDLWRSQIIPAVRGVYHGSLVYAANWNDEYQNVKFWDLLDYAGLDPYFPLSDKDRPTSDELKNAWKVPLEEIERWQQQINKPVIFTEIGYSSATGAAKRPWENSPKGDVDLELQSDLYQAVFETFWNRPWFHGMYCWYWGTNERMGGSTHRGFIIQNKPVQSLVSAWYHKERML